MAAGVRWGNDDRARFCKEMLERLEDGEAPRSICKFEWVGEDDARELKPRKPGTFPAASTFLDWHKQDEEFGRQYDTATQLGFDMMADEAMREAATATDAGLGRLRFDAKRWWLGKRCSKRYGDKVQHGSDPDNPLAFTVIERRIVSASD